MTPVVFVANEQDDEPIAVETWLRLANDALGAESTPDDVEVNVIFADEATIADLNQRFMDKEGPTDVLSFPIDELPEPPGRQPDNGSNGPGGVTDSDFDLPSMLGDVILCPAVIKRKAETHTGNLEDQIALLLVHGLLHLLGMDHNRSTDAEAMEQRERDILAEFYKELPASMWSTMQDEQ